MSKKRSHDDPTFESNPDTFDEPDAEPVTEPVTYDPEEKLEWRVLTDGAVFKTDQLKTKAADVPPAADDPNADTVVAHVSDIVSLTIPEAAAKRASGVALAEVGTPEEISQTVDKEQQFEERRKSGAAA